jgi:hypothetical protein
MTGVLPGDASARGADGICASIYLCIRRRGSLGKLRSYLLANGSWQAVTL